MRNREEIEKISEQVRTALTGQDVGYPTYMIGLCLEVLLDIRDLLKENNHP